MLQRLRIKNFKLLRDVELELNADVPTVLIGANSAGKSTVIEVLDFLSRSAADGLEDALVAHGGINAVRTAGIEAPVEIESVWVLAGGVMSWTLQFNAQLYGAVTVIAETVRLNEHLVVTTADDGQRAVVDESQPDAPPVLIKDRRRLAFESLVDPGRYRSLAALRSVVADVRVIGALSAAPRWARSAPGLASARDGVIVSTERFVGREGVGLATALYNLQVNHPDEWSRLQHALTGEFPFVKRIVFPPDPGGSRISFAFEDERFPARLIFASEMSDGMVAFLGLLALILHPEQRSALALDEPDAHLHPSAVSRVIALAHEPHPLERIIVIVTHSSAVLEELEDPAASIRIVESTPTGTRVARLDAKALAAWRTQYTMTDLRQTGLLDSSNSSYGPDE